MSEVAPSDAVMTRIRNVAERERCSLTELASRGDQQLLRLLNFGRKSIRVLRAHTGIPDPGANPLRRFTRAELEDEVRRREAAAEADMRKLIELVG